MLKQSPLLACRFSLIDDDDDGICKRFDGDDGAVLIELSGCCVSSVTEIRLRASHSDALVGGDQLGTRQFTCCGRCRNQSEQLDCAGRLH